MLDRIKGETMKKTITTTFIAVAMLFGLGVLAPSTAYALDCAGKDKATAACQAQGGIDDVGGTENKTSLTDLITNVINVLLFVAGAIAVVMIIVGGIRYITSNGDQANVKAAKDTILYSVVGLIVALLAFAIVNFVVTSL